MEPKKSVGFDMLKGVLLGAAISLGSNLCSDTYKYVKGELIKKTKKAEKAEASK